MIHAPCIAFAGLNGSNRKHFVPSILPEWRFLAVSQIIYGRQRLQLVGFTPKLPKVSVAFLVAPSLAKTWAESWLICVSLSTSPFGFSANTIFEGRLKKGATLFPLVSRARSPPLCMELGIGMVDASGLCGCACLWEAKKRLFKRDTKL